MVWEIYAQLINYRFPTLLANENNKYLWKDEGNEAVFLAVTANFWPYYRTNFGCVFILIDWRCYIDCLSCCQDYWESIQEMFRCSSVIKLIFRYRDVSTHKTKLLVSKNFRGRQETHYIYMKWLYSMRFLLWKLYWALFLFEDDNSAFVATKFWQLSRRDEIILWTRPTKSWRYLGLENLNSMRQRILSTRRQSFEIMREMFTKHLISSRDGDLSSPYHSRELISRASF